MTDAGTCVVVGATGAIGRAVVARLVRREQRLLGVARSSDESVEDPLASLKACAVSALKRAATDPQCHRVFDVVTHKCEYLGEMAGVYGRISTIQKGCVDRSEKAIRNAIRRGQLPESVNPRLAAIGLDAMHE